LIAAVDVAEGASHCLCLMRFGHALSPLRIPAAPPIVIDFRPRSSHRFGELSLDKGIGRKRFPSEQDKSAQRTNRLQVGETRHGAQSEQNDFFRAASSLHAAT
jgi:hypothetical protein